MTHLTIEALLSLREAGLEPGDASAREHLRRLPRLSGRARPAAPAGGAAQGAARLAARRGTDGRRPWPDCGSSGRRRRRQRVAGLIGLLPRRRRSPSPCWWAPGAAPPAPASRRSSRHGAVPGARERLEPVPPRRAGCSMAALPASPRSWRIGSPRWTASWRWPTCSSASRAMQQVLKLWRERVGLLDALVDVHVTRASNVGL